MHKMKQTLKDIKPTPKDTKKVFRKLGACSHTLFHLLNRDLGNTNEIKEYASDSLAGGIMAKGYQCGMLWGASLAVGAECFKRFENHNEAIGVAILATQHLMQSFRKREESIDCKDITNCDFSSKLSFAKYLLTGRVFHCFNLAEEWVPEAIETAKQSLKQDASELPQICNSCASEVAKKMGASDEEMIMVAGFAGGLGLSGNACGALSAAIWMNSIKWCKEYPGKSSFNNPNAHSTLEKFNTTTNSEMVCEKISGQRFNTLDKHTEFIEKGGCSELITALVES